MIRQNIRRTHRGNHWKLSSQKRGLKRIRTIADFQFGPSSGKAIFPDGTRIEYSARTGRIRRATYRRKVFATVLPSTGLLALTMASAHRFAKAFPPPRQRIIVEQEAGEFISQGRSVFARHVIDVDPELRPGDEVIITDRSDRILAIGRALLSPEEMQSFKRGLAVKIRAGRG